MCINSIVLEGCVLLVFSMLAFKQFLPPFIQCSLSPEGRNLMELSHLWQSDARSSLSAFSGCGSLYLFPKLQEDVALKVAEPVNGTGQ